MRGCGRPKHKPVKPMKPSAKHRKSSSSSDDSSTALLEREGDTKRFARKRFFPKDYKVKRSEEVVHACVKTVAKVLNEGGDPSHAMRHLKDLYRRKSQKLVLILRP